MTLPDITLAWLAEIGVTPDMLARHRSAPLPAHVAARQALKKVVQPPQAPAPEVSSPEPSTTPDLGSMPHTLSELQAFAHGCQACSLHQQRLQVVFGAGDTQDVEWLVIGEAPGSDDDRKGIPFQGDSGTLLVAMLAAVGCYPQGLGRHDVAVPQGLRPLRMYFTQLVKCRPLGQRGVQSEQIAACQSILLQQIRLLQPQRLLLLGEATAHALLRTEDAMDALRQTVHTFQAPWGARIPAMVTWHPTALLLRPQLKPQAWADMRYLQKLTDMPSD